MKLAAGAHWLAGRGLVGAFLVFSRGNNPFICSPSHCPTTHSHVLQPTARRM